MKNFKIKFNITNLIYLWKKVYNIRQERSDYMANDNETAPIIVESINREEKKILFMTIFMITL